MNDAHLRVTCFPFVFELDIIHVVIIRHLNMESFTNITLMATSNIKILGNKACLQSIEGISIRVPFHYGIIYKEDLRMGLISSS